ncbi:MAG: FxsA family protein [Alphaproteobacteria bacterium]|nr:FxsA family protein [Alphaproteobacteria bacterium SS10]
MPALIILIAWPLAEIAMFVAVGEQVGVAITLLLILTSATIGIALISSQGRQSFEQARATVQTKREPLAEAMVGLTTIFGGVLLIIPGFLTDMVGLAFALPGLRNLTAGWLHSRLKHRATVHTSAGGYPPGGQARPSGDPVVIEGDYTVVEDGDDSRGNTPNETEGDKPRPN